MCKALMMATKMQLFCSSSPPSILLLSTVSLSLLGSRLSTKSSIARTSFLSSLIFPLGAFSQETLPSPVYFAVSEGQLDIVVPGYGVQADLLCEAHVNNEPSRWAALVRSPAVSGPWGEDLSQTLRTLQSQQMN